MRNKRLIFALAGAVLCGVLGVMLVTRYVSGIQAYAKDLGNVVVAKTEIPLGQKITREHLMLASMPNGSAPDGSFRKIEEVVDRVAITTIGVKEPVTSMKLAPEGTGAGLSAVIPDGYRAMTVRVDDVVGVSGFIMPGSFVDIVAIIVPSGQQAGEAQGPISKIVLQNIKVLASGAKLDSPENQREPSKVTGVTLQVTPEQAEKLVLASNEGKLQLVMRNYGDAQDSQTKGASKNSLLSGETFVPQPKPKTDADLPKAAHVKQPVRRAIIKQPRIERPAIAPPPPRNSVELIEGNKRRDVDMP